MRLLICTQAVDRNDPVLGFFHAWIEALAKRAESVEVICLKEGEHALPGNVRVHSLGKNKSPRQGTMIYHSALRIRYTWCFVRYIVQLHNQYDAVFVHMNQEYVLLAGWYWKLLGKRVYLWRNHYQGSFLTDIAAMFCAKVFCTSKHSYTAKYKKTVLMPVGVDTRRFFPDARITRVPHSILFFARMSPAKRPEMLIAALATLAKDGVEFVADFYGSPLAKHERWYASVKKRVHSLGLEASVRFYPGPPNYEAPDIFRAHEIFVNCSPSGMFDKMIFEAAACGCRVLASSDDWRALAGPDMHFDSSEKLALRLSTVLGKGAERPLDSLVRAHSLVALLDSLDACMKNNASA